MTKEDKELLLRDLSARLPYGVRCQWKNWSHSIGITSIAVDPKYPNDVCINLHIYADELHLLKPYLRPMSSMTDEEEIAFLNKEDYEIYDYLNKHHFDFRGLIKKGLAIAVTEENNPYK